MWKVPQGLAGSVGLNSIGYNFDEQPPFWNVFSESLSSKIWSLSLNQVDTYIPNLSIGKYDPTCDNEKSVKQSQSGNYFTFPLNAVTVNGEEQDCDVTNVIVHTGIGGWVFFPSDIVETIASLVDAKQQKQGIYVLSCDQANTDAVVEVKFGEDAELNYKIQVSTLVQPKEDWVESSSQDSSEGDCELKLYPVDGYLVFGRSILVDNCLSFNGDSEEMELAPKKSDK